MLPGNVHYVMIYTRTPANTYSNTHNGVATWNDDIVGFIIVKQRGNKWW